MFNPEKWPSEPDLGAEKQKEKSEARKKLEKKLRAMMVWGVVTLSSLGVFKAFKEYKPEYKYKPKALMAYVEKERPLTVIEKIELKKKIDYLREQFSDRIIPLLLNSTEINKESAAESMKISGFEKAKLSNKDLQKLWSEKYYPEGWLDEEIGEVEYVDIKEKMDPRYDLKGGGIPVAACEGVGKSKITFFKAYSLPETKAEEKNFIAALNWHFIHEASHANDWETEAQLDFKSRTEFLCEITESCFKQGSFRDFRGYIDSIKSPDSCIGRYIKVKEYWATICDHYFSMPELLKELYSQEFELVDKYVKREDPTFNPFEKFEQREELIKDIIKRRKNKIG